MVVVVFGIHNTCSFDYHSSEPMRHRVVWLDLNWSNTKCAYIIFFLYCRKFDVFWQNDVDDDDCWWCKFDITADGIFSLSLSTCLLAVVRTQLLSICNKTLYEHIRCDDTSKKHLIIDVVNVGKNWDLLLRLSHWVYDSILYILCMRTYHVTTSDLSFAVLDAFDVGTPRNQKEMNNTCPTNNKKLLILR